MSIHSGDYYPFSSCHVAKWKCNAIVGSFAQSEQIMTVCGYERLRREEMKIHSTAINHFLRQTCARQAVTAFQLLPIGNGKNEWKKKKNGANHGGAVMKISNGDLLCCGPRDWLLASQLCVVRLAFDFFFHCGIAARVALSTIFMQLSYPSSLLATKMKMSSTPHNIKVGVQRDHYSIILCARSRLCTLFQWP